MLGVNTPADPTTTRMLTVIRSQEQERQGLPGLKSQQTNRHQQHVY